tara:strand:+ start:1985 stop:2173 length:189 start_codon:yes stop_codon:yes gene_type:complete
MKLLKKLSNILIKLIQMLGLLLLGFIVVILAPISMLVDGVKKELIQELPPDEDIEFSERWRG